MKGTLRFGSTIAAVGLAGSLLVALPASATDSATDTSGQDVTTSTVEMVETEIPTDYTDSVAVPEAVGDQQQVEAVTQVSEEAVEVQVARVDFQSDIAILGLMWNNPHEAPAAVEYRTLAGGVWSAWVPVELEDNPVRDGAPSSGTQTPAGTATGEIVLANVESAEVIAKDLEGTGIPGLELVVIDPQGEGEIGNSLEGIEAEQEIGPSVETEEDAFIPLEEAPITEESTDEDATVDNQVEGPQSGDLSLDLDDAAAAGNATFPVSIVPMTVGLNTAGTQYDTGMNGLVINTRKAWGGPNSSDWKPESITIQGAVIHHTAGSNDYTKAQVPSIIKGIYTYHANTLEWDDIGYNLIVDKYGGVWEGRYGGLTKGVKGAQAYGANSETFGISVLGNYETAAPTSAGLTALEKAVAWKLSVHKIKSIDGTIRVPGEDLKGRNVPVVSAHRDVGSTLCPGKNLYSKMNTIRTAIKGYMTVVVQAPAATATPTPAVQTKTPGWDASLIISDTVFKNKSSMTEAQITAFIKDKGASCKKSADGKSTCLKDKKFPTQKLTTDRGGCKALTLTGSQTPGKIIYSVAQACSINPQVLLAMIQKESSGITQPLTEERWAKAMGSGCPTGQTCSPAEAGFTKQVYYGADKLVSYGLNPTAWPYVKAAVAGTKVTIPYHPTASCGGQTFVIKNVATASLYTYNPYVPNAASLAAYPGEGDNCSHYGWRNFYMSMSTWFPGSVGPTPTPTATATPKPTATATPKPTSSPKANWNPRKKIGTGWTGLIVYTGDMNGDGIADRLRRDTKGVLWFYQGKANDGWSKKVKIGTGWNSMDKIVGGVDWDGDGKRDVIARHKSTGKLYLYRGNGKGKFVSGRIQIGSGWSGVRDFTVSNSAIGPVIYGLIGDSLYAYPGKGTAGFKSRFKVGAGWTNFDKIAAVGDWTGDGVADIVGRSKSGTGRLYLYQGKKTGTVSRVAKIGSSGWNNIANLGVSSQVGKYNTMLVGYKNGALYSYKFKGYY